MTVVGCILRDFPLKFSLYYIILYAPYHVFKK